MNGMNNGYQGGNPNMNGMNNGYQSGNPNMNGMNNGYQSRNPNMNGMNNGYQGGNLNMNGMNNGYQGGNPNMNGMNYGYQDVNPNINGGHQGGNLNMNGLINSNSGVSTQQYNQSEFQDITAYKQRLRGMKEVQDLTGEVEVQNPNSIIMFGQRASENISKISDELLNSMKAVKSEEATEMLSSLTKLMDKFDIKELENTKGESFMSKIFKNVGNTVAKLFQKYDTMGYEVEKIYVLLKKYENDIRESNSHLKKLYDGNFEYYQMLEKYIVAGEMALEEIDMYLNQMSNDMTMGQEEKQMIIQKLEISKEMLSQRVYDLRIAENVAIQAAPMIQTIQMSNFNLMRKINSSFIVTLPIFKQCLAQAIILKRQEIQAKSIKQLDDKTNELIMRNASNTARQSVEIAKMASGSSIAIETLEKSYATIMKGIEDTKSIQESNRAQREENAKKLETLKHNMKKEFVSI
ncbi:toxic anion resistance protein [Clostridium perfringens]|nr:toxic anion resistance protein [Clostridium perfringens]